MSDRGGERLEKDFSRSCFVHSEKFHARRVSEPNNGFLFFLLAFTRRLNKPLAFDDLFFLLHISTFCVYVGQEVISGQGERKKAVWFCLCLLTGQKNITGNLNTNFSFTLKAWTLWWRGKT